MAEEHNNKSLREYASFDLERRGYDRAQVDAFLAELDQAFVELETSVKERGTEIAALQMEIERLKRESPTHRADEILRRAEENAEQMLATSLAEGQEIISNAETVAMRIIANAREQSEELANQPPGFGMLARVRTIAADIDRIKAEHAALMEEAPEDEPPAEEPAAVANLEPAVTEPDEPAAAREQAATVQSPTPDEAPDAKTTPKKPAAQKTAPKKPAAKKPAAKKTTAKGATAKTSGASTKEDAAEERVAEKPAKEPVKATHPQRVQLVEPEPLDEDEVVDARNFDWSAARQQVLTVRDDEPLVDELKRGEQAQAGDDEEEAADERDVPTIIRREGSRYERHSASLPKLGDDAGAALSDVSKVSRRRRKRAPVRDEEPA